MLDLSKPLGQIEGLTLFRDHEQANLVFYLPDEIGLRFLTADQPDLSLQIFFPDQAVVGGEGSLDRAVGSILSLGATCQVSSARLENARGAIKDLLGREDARLSLPPWEDGTVDLLLLDAQTGETMATAIKDDKMVRGVVGSRKPSLSDAQLSALFHARLDRRGTALVSAAIAGQVGSLAGILYDLKFAALRPTVDLRMSANLDRVAEFFSAGVGVQVYYVSADIRATFGKMKENGVIKVDLVSQATDPESERMVNEAVNDFYEVLMRELFKPSVSPSETLGAMGSMVGASSMQTSIVKFSFSYTRVQHERVIEIDYRKRSATRRTHNPQAHLKELATLVKPDRLVQRVPLSAAWREFTTEIAAPSAFEDPPLRQVRVVLWRGRDEVLGPVLARDGGLRQPAQAAALADIALSKADAAPRHLSWVTDPQEAPFYRWQARLTYAPQDNVDSPPEIWSEPHVSSSADLDLFPEILAPRKRVTLKLGADNDEELKSVDADLIARDPAGKEIARKRITVDPARPDATWAVRRGEQQQVVMEGALTYRYAGGRTVVKPAQRLLDAEIFANNPFIRIVTLSPLVAGAPADLVEVMFIVRYANDPAGYRHEVVRRLRPPDFKADDVKMWVLNSRDTVQWEATAVRASGQTIAVGHGDSSGGVTMLLIANTRRIRVEWIGPTPADLGLRWLRATFRARKDDGTVLETSTLEWKGANVDGERVVTLPNEGRAEWSISKRTDDGQTDTSPFTAIRDDLLTVSG